MTEPAFAQRHRDRRTLAIDLAFYTGCCAFAVISALSSEFYGFRIWGTFAGAAYGLGVVHTGWLLVDGRLPAWRGLRALKSRWTPIAVVGVLGMLAPLIMLVLRRLTGRDWLVTPWSWAAQPEVWVIERSAKLLLNTGTPYTDVTALGRIPDVNDYTPYGPSMSVFGLPRALFGDVALTDARIVFALTAVGCVLGALRLLGRPRPGTAVPVRAAQLAIACPLTALTWAVAGPDLAIIGLIVLASALVARRRPGWAGGVLAVVLSAKLTALPAVVVLAVLVAAALGRRALGRFGALHLAGCAVLNVPVLLVAPRAFAEHVILFPSGLGQVSSPAASPLPGYLLASTGQLGRVIAFVLLAAAAAAITAWLLLRPPRLASDALLRIAVGLTAATLLTPATRWGYLVYPAVLLGAALYFAAAERQNSTADGATGEGDRAAQDPLPRGQTPAL